MLVSSLILFNDPTLINDRPRSQIPILRPDFGRIRKKLAVRHVVTNEKKSISPKRPKMMFFEINAFLN